MKLKKQIMFEVKDEIEGPTLAKILDALEAAGEKVILGHGAYSSIAIYKMIDCEEDPKEEGGLDE